MNTERMWLDYYRKALETVQLELEKPLQTGENFTQRRAYILGYIEGALKMVHVEINEEQK